MPSDDRRAVRCSEWLITRLSRHPVDFPILRRHNDHVKQVIIARHGETDWNVGEVFRGRADVPLNQTGQAQAQALGRHLAGLDIGAVYSSPLKRAMDTAAAIAGHHDLEVTVVDELMDIDFGQWQGLGQAEIKSRYPELHRQWQEQPHLVAFPGGESLDDVARRAMRVVDRAVESGGSSTVLVSHRVVSKLLICCLLGLDSSHFWNIRLDVTGTTIFEYEGGRFTLTRHNDTSHLEPALRHTLGDF